VGEADAEGARHACRAADDVYNPDAGEHDENQLTLDAAGNEVHEPSDARLAAEAAFSDPGAEGMDPGFDATKAFVDAHAAD